MGLHISFDMPEDKKKEIFVWLDNVKYPLTYIDNQVFDAPRVAEILEDIGIDCSLLKKIFDIEEFPKNYKVERYCTGLERKTLDSRTIEQLLNFTNTAIDSVEKNKENLLQKLDHFSKMNEYSIASGLKGLKLMYEKALELKVGLI